MASNQNFDNFGWLFGSSLVGDKGFLKSQGAYLGSAEGFGYIWSELPVYKIMPSDILNRWLSH